MEVTYGQAETLVGFKSATWSDHCDLGGLERKVGGKHKLAMVVPTCIYMHYTLSKRVKVSKTMINVWLGTVTTYNIRC